MKKFKKKKYLLNKEKKYIIISLSLLIGIIIGSISANNLEQVVDNDLYEYINKFLLHFDISIYNQTNFLSDVFINNIKIILIIFVCCFSIIGIIIALIYLGVLGFTYGFTISYFIKEFGIKGFFINTIMYLPHIFILIPVIYFIFISGMNLCINNKKNNHNKFNKSNMVEYFLSLIIAIVFIFLFSLFETYLIPKILKIII